ncbi:hypothetical protein M514_03579 [Trichuris suis]|uniref:Inward rectifier potassium channel C-terminal domain-containing protein n=1 Tax=Trichuris suis TaxID=68888 RepID=A0A085ME81_9BILA|nr:hypothetical protein M513_03579 [Trichuris suis]KFD71329.1 hypothetical protein M514_03579 [Trichuris suis]KHJ48361.1 inward rectifier potassium channel 2 domain protein [Trichuris suis]
MRDTHLLEAHVRLQMIRKTVTDEGEVLPLDQHEMNVGFDRGLDRLFLIWPVTICHVIDDKSPLYEYSCQTLKTAQFEIVAILEGIIESTGMTAQALTSYLPSEIHWGHRFEELITNQNMNGGYQVDWSLFHKTFAVKTPRKSARRLDEIKLNTNSNTSEYCGSHRAEEIETDDETPSPELVVEASPKDAEISSLCATVKGLQFIDQNLPSPSQTRCAKNLPAIAKSEIINIFTTEEESD